LKQSAETAFDADDENAIAVVATAVALNGNRRVIGVLRGFDQFMNVVLENCVEDKVREERF
jgi:hypothetical protein